MQKILLTGMLAAALLVPAAAYAQTTSISPTPDAKTDRTLVIQSAQVLAIGAGVIVGAVVAEALISTRIALLVGGVAGGYLANIWYTGREIDIHMDTPPKI